jgi:hypothetical protein
MSIQFQFKSSDNTENSLDLYLHLKSPPLISLVKFWRRNDKGDKVEQNRAELRTLPGDRTTHWLYKRLPRQKLKEPIRAVAESPYIRINFTKDGVSF